MIEFDASPPPRSDTPLIFEYLVFYSFATALQGVQTASIGASLPEPFTLESLVQWLDDVQRQMEARGQLIQGRLNPLVVSFLGAHAADPKPESALIPS